MINLKDKQNLQDLAKRYAELAAMPINQERKQRGKDINDLKPRRPMVWLDEIPWHEINIDDKLTLTCQDESARYMEWFFKSTLYRFEYIQADMVIEPFFPIYKAFSTAGELEVQEHKLATDDQNYIVSHSYIDQLDTIEKVNAIADKTLTAFPDLDNERAEQASDILKDILPVKIKGHFYYHAPWDKIPRYRGVTPIMMDLIDNPELIHATIKRFTEIGLSEMKQMEALNLLDNEASNLHCTPGYVSDLAVKENEKVTLKNTWFRTMAQMFTDVSPAMWDEFELQYAKPLAAECGLTYYGCCEALDNKIDLLRSIPNLRKIGVPPRANPEVCAEQIKGDYVYAHKPNPAFVAGTFDAATVKNEIERVINTCQKNGCAYEFTLKDISTAGYNPHNLIDWVNTVMGTIDAHYK